MALLFELMLHNKYKLFLSTSISRVFLFLPKQLVVGGNMIVFSGVGSVTHRI